jgi:hypothetical protein
MVNSQNEPASKWVYGPAARAFRLVTEEIVLAGLTERATFSLIQLPTLLSFIRSESKHKILKNHKQLERLHAMSLEDAEFAKKEVEAGFSRLHIHSIMSLWSFVEACLEDTAVALIKKCNKSDLCQGSVLFEHANDLPILDDQAALRFKRKFLNIVKDSIRSNFMLSFEIFFKCFDINLNNQQDTLNKMQEINSLRNCALHRSKIVDDYALLMSPEIPFKVGEEIIINTQQYNLYMSAIGDYILNFHNKILQSKYMTMRND